jgi:hypothetical protein
MFQFQILNVGIGDVDHDLVYVAFTRLRSSSGKVLVALARMQRSEIRDRLPTMVRYRRDFLATEGERGD